MFSVSLSWKHLGLLLFLLGFPVATVANDNDAQAYSQTGQDLTPDEFYQRLVTGDYDVIVDVRRRADEWDTLGHVSNATLVESLASYTSDNTTLGKPSDLEGCEFCDIIIYCRSGRRAAVAITILRQAGFQGRLWNGLGVNQWTEAGYDLVFTDSVVPPCTTDSAVSDACENKHLTNTSGTGGCEGLQGNIQDRCVNSIPPAPSSLASSRNAGLWFLLPVGGFLLGNM